VRAEYDSKANAISITLAPVGPIRWRRGAKANPPGCQEVETLIAALLDR